MWSKTASKRWCCVLILIFESYTAILGSGDSAYPDPFDDADWPIFAKVNEHLSSLHREWVTLPSNQQNSRVDAQKTLRYDYPVFEDDCQIPKLNEIYMQVLGYIENGTFIEVGGSDGRRWSNTYQLANIGWTGHYIEPVPQYAHVCAANHFGNPKVRTHILAIGATTGKTKVYVGASLSTCSKEMLDVYSGLDWSAGYHSGEVVEAPLRTLDYFLATVGASPGFEVLVIDVEGLEWEVLLGFSALRWRPRVVIVEIEDTHESFRSIGFLQERYRRVRGYFKARGYREHWRDHINTVFVRIDSSPPSAAA